LLLSHDRLLSISVAMCTFNGARFLREQLDSVLQQSTLPDQLVVCDDGSTDETIAILDEYSHLAPFPIGIHRNPVRLGYGSNFARCIDLCSGDLIVLSDQDDIWLPNRIENTYAAFAVDDQLSLTFSDAELIDDDGSDLKRTLYQIMRIRREDRRRFEDGTSILPNVLVYGGILGCTVAFRSKFLPIILPIPETWTHDWWISLVLCTLGHTRRIGNVVRYRQHPAQTVGFENLSLKLRMKQVRAQKAVQYREEIRHYQFALDAAKIRLGLQEKLLPALQSRIDFLYERSSVRCGGIQGIWSLAGLLRSGTYWKLGAGWGSLLKDVASLAGCFRIKRDEPVPPRNGPH
jgi:glycosyltransferase involved in cell wall biosynthesis